ncbi:beta-ketoacyl-[acyl-carrier-protein] synthase family protein [Candidatus Laterigemmans baculatus]|uniref:beta-ketoacyl-[acyl-carrier-protein] synthase family protein n=1 Tax=Candidatus Laterigemmans baculatus TaxID=2770505 RepID=UPI0013D9CDF3|nr:beta-ketoacyl synthase N-terminal-like domain-containing protein [Candidatus Laterigemmans baculatus]
MTASRDVVITGVGVVSPLGIGHEPFWQAMSSGQSGIRWLDGGTGEVARVGFGGQLIDYDPRAYVRPRKALKVMSREIQTAFSAAVLAMEHAALDPSEMPADRVATIFGSEMMSGEPEELAEALQQCGVTSGDIRAGEFGEAAMRNMFPLWMLKYLPNMAACHVGIAVGALGPNNTLVVGDTSALAAAIESASVLRRGIADCVITGAAGTRISPTRLIYRSGLGIPTLRDPVAASSRPLASDRDGVVAGEGAGCLILESDAAASRRGVRPLAVMLGSAVRFIPSCDGSSASSAAIGKAIAGALADAGVAASDLGMVVSHAMGDRRIDAAEAAAVEKLGEDLPVVAPIAALGHTGAASGSLDLVTAVLALVHRVVPPTVNAAERDPECRVRLLSEAQPLDRPLVLVISHTPQGHAAAVVLGAASGCE